jgi:hypothetical protein
LGIGLVFVAVGFVLDGNDLRLAKTAVAVAGASRPLP